ncbi:MAG: hypothetical protein ACTSW1_17890 [Candidatus Hodarchaeales archaeon]
MESCTVGEVILFDDSKEVIISNVGLNDSILHNLLKSMTEEERIRFIQKSIMIGFEVIQLMDRRTQIDHIKLEFEKMKNELENELDNTFSEKGLLSQKMEQYFGGKGEVTQLFNQYLGEENSAICNVLNHRDEETPLGRFRKELEHLLDIDKQGTAFNQLKECIETGLENILHQIEQREAVEQATALERSKGTAKGRDFQDSLTEIVDAFAGVFDDTVEFVGDTTGHFNKVGDIKITINPKETKGKERSIIIEAKQSNVNLTGKNSFIKELDEALENRSSEYAIGAIHEDKALDSIGVFRRFSDDKIVCSIPSDLHPFSLEIAYKVARAEIISKILAESSSINAQTILNKIEEIKSHMEIITSTKRALTGAQNNIDKAYDNIDNLQEDIRNCTDELTKLLKS